MNKKEQVSKLFNISEDSISCIITLEQVEETYSSTCSTVYLNGEFLCFAIEDGYRNPKERAVTRIPEGIYEVIQSNWGRHYDSYSVRFNHSFTTRLENVPGFVGIVIHIGNTVKDTEGCILLNSGIVYDSLKKEFKGVGSTTAYLDYIKKIEPYFKKGKVFMEINR